MVLLYGRAGRLTAKNGGFGPGQGVFLVVMLCIGYIFVLCFMFCIPGQIGTKGIRGPTFSNGVPSLKFMFVFWVFNGIGAHLLIWAGLIAAGKTMGWGDHSFGYLGYFDLDFG